MKSEHELKYEHLMDNFKGALTGSDHIVLMLIHNQIVYMRKEWSEKIEMLENRIKALQLELTFKEQK